MAGGGTVERGHHWWPLGPDGALQLGVGPGAWAVAGGLPPGPAETLGWRVVERLATAPGSRHRDVTPTDVRGPGHLVGTLRACLAPTAAPLPPTGAGRDDRPASPSPRPAWPSPTGRAVVTVHDHVVPVGTARQPGLTGRPVLPVVAQSTRVVIGPWTGLAGGPCLHCLDLHRRDRDPAWPARAAALEDPLTAPLPPAVPDEVLRAVVALVALLTARVPATATGDAHEVGPWHPHLVTRRWSRHVACPWHAGTGAG
ncbi:hypothetical protein AVL62_06815 [Serinicoccus chungangensis]|uniref:Bacteriocin biosynthesis cyclodehydratase domain-containing protein n=1 Tax=Serinicoccus chungangensis TaxID=767452 RepID=A0A0W8IHA4_9MICO|nr:hypothetical protein [Serinicoccus chungangensis]KUG59380.1 hypothetical protein AVL62_06815 [Serinicoccus chungangensis]